MSRFRRYAPLFARRIVSARRRVVTSETSTEEQVCVTSECSLTGEPGGRLCAAGMSLLPRRKAADDKARLSSPPQPGIHIPSTLTDLHQARRRMTHALRQGATSSGPFKETPPCPRSSILSVPSSSSWPCLALSACAEHVAASRWCGRTNAPAATRHVFAVVITSASRL
jgi:hypothetical protein